MAKGVSARTTPDVHECQRDIRIRAFGMGHGSVKSTRYRCRTAMALRDATAAPLAPNRRPSAMLARRLGSARIARLANCDGFRDRSPRHLLDSGYDIPQRSGIAKSRGCQHERDLHARHERAMARRQSARRGIVGHRRFVRAYIADGLPPRSDDERPRVARCEQSWRLAALFDGTAYGLDSGICEICGLYCGGLQLQKEVRGTDTQT